MKSYLIPLFGLIILNLGNKSINNRNHTNGIKFKEMYAVLILVLVVIVLVFLYYKNKKSKSGVEEVIDQIDLMSDAEYGESVRQLQVRLGKTKFKNVVTGEAFIYSGQGNFIRLGNNAEIAKYLKFCENVDYIEEFRIDPGYSIEGRYNKDYYITYFDEKPYVSLPLLQTLYLFDESKWRKVLYPIKFIDGFGYDFLEFLQLSLLERHPDHKWLEDRSSDFCNRFYFKDLTAEEILSVPTSFL
ncbi:hypothetical protein [Flavobacterium sp. Root420]|uniref:hypothetical protein n=1 Tax=Flavobacterium sp. Root420 TaxID=1736533 RepID=UPI0006F687E7|nr:hypothetical protein [Flavobacterium sp. Root420]KQW99245.1 hypothetical protein ASC72_09145 [Flavobacterium sp. Root420]